MIQLKTLVLRVLLSACVCLAVSTSAFSQSVRVVAPGAAVRVSPSASSPVIMTAGLGTVLEAGARQGNWYQVFLPPDRNGLRRMGYVSVNDVELTRQAMALPADWLQRHRAALAKESSGRFKVWSGIAMTGAGTFMSIYGSRIRRETVCSASCVSYQTRRNVGLAWTGLGVLVAGGVFQRWGWMQINSANRELAELERERGRPRGRVGLRLMPEGVFVSYATTW